MSGIGIQFAIPNLLKMLGCRPGIYEEGFHGKSENAGRGPDGRAEMGLPPASPASLKRLLPLYAVVFAGFVGYSLMITVFTPMIMSNHDFAPALLAQLCFLSRILWIFPLLSNVSGRPLPSRRVAGFGVCGMGGRPHCDRQRLVTGFLAARFTTRTLTVCSAFLTGAFIIVVVAIPARGSLWVTLFLTSAALAICLPACATLLSKATSEAEQGRVMGNNQALQVGAEALSGLVGGLAAALFVELPLILLGLLAMAAALLMKFGVKKVTAETP